MDYLPGSHGNQSDEKKFCHFFFFADIISFWSKRFIWNVVPGREVHKE